MTTLYAIREDFRGVKLLEVNVSGETEKRFSIDDSKICRSILNKKELYDSSYGLMFGTDADLLIQKWNEHIDEKIKRLEQMLEKERLNKYVGEIRELEVK